MPKSCGFRHSFSNNFSSRIRHIQNVNSTRRLSFATTSRIRLRPKALLTVRLCLILSARQKTFPRRSDMNFGKKSLSLWRKNSLNGPRTSFISVIRQKISLAQRCNMPLIRRNICSPFWRTDALSCLTTGLNDRSSRL
jgi:hypothetical protein